MMKVSLRLAVLKERGEVLAGWEGVRRGDKGGDGIFSGSGIFN